MPPAIHAIDLVHMNVPGAIAAWAVEGPDGWVVIESGPASCWNTLRTGLESLGATIDNIAALLVTHIHLDHAGGAWNFVDRGIPVHVHEAGAAHLIDPSRLEKSSRRIFGERFETLWGALKPCDASRVHAYRNGDIVSAAGLQFAAIETLGHANHHHAWHLLDHDSGDLFSGDAAAMLVPGTEWITIPMPPPEFDLDVWMAAIDRIETGPWTRLRLTHGGTVADISAHLKQLRISMRDQVQWIAATAEMPPEKREQEYRKMLWKQASGAHVPESLFRDHVSPGLIKMNLGGIDLWTTSRAAQQP